MNAIFDYSEQSLDTETLVSLYRNMLTSRLIEEKMLILLRQGKISKWFSGIGQEAIATGVTLALKKTDYILPMHRNLGVFTGRDIPLYRLFSQWQGKANGFTKGRDRSFHFGTQEYRIIGMISHLGPQLGVACGIALHSKLKHSKEVTAVFTGEGGTSEGDFHEALNVASVWQLPVLFCIENNGYGLSTPSKEQYNCENLADRGVGYGMESHQIEGNNIIEVYQKIHKIAEGMREHPRPVLIEFKTFRVRGHEEASGTKYVPEAQINEWKEKDPIAHYREYLIEKEILTQQEDAHLIKTITNEIERDWQQTEAEKDIFSTLQEELDDVYHHIETSEYRIKNEDKRTIRYIDAIAEGLEESLKKHQDLILMGQDIAEYGGVFKITEGFVSTFGKDRIRNTPICESIIVSTAYGLSLRGCKSVVEMQFADFVSSGFNPIVNLLAKSNYRWGQSADVVIRMPCGGGVGAGPFHSQTNEAWFTKTPGLKVVYPAFPIDAKGLLIAAINDPNPVLFFEHKALYRTIKQPVPEGYFEIAMGKAAVLKKGNRVTVISYGAGVHWALEILEKQGFEDIDLIDLRTLQPLDTQAIYKSVKKTGKSLILQEDSLFGGIASEIAALIQENCFQYLDAPVIRVGSLETPIPFNQHLEEQYLAKSRFEAALLELLKY